MYSFKIFHHGFISSKGLFVSLSPNSCHFVHSLHNINHFPRDVLYMKAQRMKVHHIYALYVHVSNKNKNITKFTMFLRFTYWFQNLLLQMELEKEMKTVEQY